MGARSVLVTAAVPVSVSRSRSRSLALGAGLERVAAAAGRGGVRVLDGEAAAHQVFLVIHLGAFEIPQAHRVHDDLDALLLEDLVTLGRSRSEERRIGSD